MKLFLLLSFLVSTPLFAQDAQPRVQAHRLAADEAITIDGRLDEAAWSRAIPASDFTQQDPDFGTPATERTEVRFLFSRNSLYMGVHCFDSEPDRLMGNTMQRDAFLSADDRFMWTFDPYLDGRSGYFFEMNPSGAMGDSLISAAEAAGGGGGARAWDGIWYANVSKSDTGWTIEIEIPFQTLNFNPDAPAWGVNFQRTVRRKNEESLWTGWARNQGLQRMTNAGRLEGIEDVSQGIGLNVQPYVSGSYTDLSGRNQGTTYKGNVGADFTYSITPQLKGSFTLNTDFAETQVDQRLVNLTRFPLFFPEQRGFFLEGSTFFDFTREQGNTITPFFSRRIGLTNGQPQRIDWGSKLTGQIGSNDLGVLHVRTGRQGSLISEDFTILRSKQRFFIQSYAGMIYTRRAERNTAAPERHTLGADFQLATSRFRGSQNLNMSGFYVFTSGLGAIKERAAYGLRVEYPNDLIFARMAYRTVRPNYNPASGFVDRHSFRRYNPEFEFAPRPNSAIIRRFVFAADPEIITDLNNRLVSRALDLTPLRIDFQSDDSFNFYVNPIYDRLEEDFEISDGVTLPSGNVYRFTRYGIQAQTANRRIVAVTTRYERGDFYSGRRRDFAVDMGIRPRAGVLINLNNEWNRVELAEGKFSTAVLRLNANTQFSPWISVVNNVQYDSVSRLLGWQSRFRWIVRPGNDVFFVYAHNWLDDPAGGGRHTLDRKAAAKILYTKRF